MSYWELYERTRRIPGFGRPHYATVWVGRDDEQTKRYCVMPKPDPDTEDGPIYAMQGGPIAYKDDPTTIREAIARYREQKES